MFVAFFGISIYGIFTDIHITSQPQIRYNWNVKIIEVLIQIT